MNLSVPVGGKLWEGPTGLVALGGWFHGTKFRRLRDWMISWNKIKAQKIFCLDDFMDDWMISWKIYEMIG